MDMETYVREKLKDFYERHKPHQANIQLCPFRYKHQCCAVLFPGWAKKYYISDHMEHEGCPCARLSHNYVRRTARAFVKKK